MQGEVEVPDPPEDLHPTAKAWYHSLKESGQSIYMEPSDWHTAILVAHAIDKFLETGHAAQLKVALDMMKPLLVTEGDRRRAQIEIERDANTEKPDESVLADYRKKLGVE